MRSTRCRQIYVRTMSNVEIVVEEEPPPGQRLLGLYQGVPLPKRSSQYGSQPRNCQLAGSFHRKARVWR
jgi:predicted Zn-dependent protease with MMP-like domain